MARVELESAVKHNQKLRGALKQAQTEERRKAEEIFSKRLKLAEEQISECKEEVKCERKDSSEREERLLQECEEKMKCMLKDSSEREERLLQEQQVEVEHLQIKVNDHQQEALQLREENTSLLKEICLLQETVRRECEERAELTAALSLAREQLLGVTQMTVNSSIPHSPATSSLPSLSVGPSRDNVNRGRSTASWHGNSRQPLPALPRLATERPAPVTEARHRISTVTGRKDKRSH
ncbi:Leucine-, glutamate- and lysine-rich protein 1 [Bagarius yarrelli]|uniref:Leucine-, glutamate-and lysine-rich protein 1 n=1 Tax=Bagarius yarrelli TaxID=175774 RepID=A0A556TQQ2_BAGYA|nr:Leucine-, glutamate- and lysine-rich protein 1 [Bagarius yarrelli]